MLNIQICFDHALIKYKLNKKEQNITLITLFTKKNTWWYYDSRWVKEVNDKLQNNKNKGKKPKFWWFSVCKKYIFVDVHGKIQR